MMEYLLEVIKEKQAEEKRNIGRILYDWGGISLNEARGIAHRFPNGELAEQLRACGVLNEDTGGSYKSAA